MGYGSYSYEAHQAMTAARAALPQQEVFKQRACHPLMSPFGVKHREARDSPDHPESLGIVFALDVSGSMGEIPELIARSEMPRFMKTLGDAGIAHPQVLFSALSDVASNQAPLQVGQFESTAALMDQWLTWTWIEGGGASEYESYDLALYFFAHHTKMDCWEKRKKKGYLFMTGDEPCYPKLDPAKVKGHLGDDLDRYLRLSEVIADAQRTFEVFFLIPERDRAARVLAGQTVEAFWREHLGSHAVVMESPADTCAVAAGLVALGEKAVPSVDALVRSYVAHGMAKERAEAVGRVLAGAR